jgi:nitroimidazol reductase NimA-like FMN-containing flavoprotein (pyridoxamine 5'-phosphate oxidase superfamily)
VAVCPALDGDRIVLASDRRARKTTNIAARPLVALAFDEYSEDWSELRQVVVFGRARIVESGPPFERGRRVLYDKYEQYENEAPIEDGTSVIIEIAVGRTSAAGVR